MPMHQKLVFHSSGLKTRSMTTQKVILVKENKTRSKSSIWLDRV